mgnify:CR=1 FL=1
MRPWQFTGVLAIASLAWAQEPSRLAFEVASIKPTTATFNGWSTSNVTSQFGVKGMSLRDLIKFAWTLQDYALDAPNSLDGPRYDIGGKLPEGAPHTPRPANPMIPS